MMFSYSLARYLHTGRTLWAAEKSLLATLRKKTGYTFTNCKKALELHNNDLTQAEKWLQDQAQAMGWSKATKLEGRQTTQGLIGVAVKDNNGALVEVNCETDFVARNKNFQEMVEEATKACLQFTLHQQSKSPLTKIALSAEQLKALPAENGKTLGDNLALFIGTVGENASLRRAVCFKGDTGVYLAGYTHPAAQQPSSVMLGKFGAILAYKAHRNETTDKVSKQICQHIVGMNPKKIGDVKKDTPNTNKDEETCLIFQDFVVDEDLKVAEVLNEYDMEIIKFKRMECGEQDLHAIPLDQVETCQ